MGAGSNRHLILKSCHQLTFFKAYVKFWCASEWKIQHTKKVIESNNVFSILNCHQQIYYRLISKNFFFHFQMQLSSINTLHSSWCVEVWERWEKIIPRGCLKNSQAQKVRGLNTYKMNTSTYYSFSFSFYFRFLPTFFDLAKIPEACVYFDLAIVGWKDGRCEIVSC